jgi:hypothetical protein
MVKQGRRITTTCQEVFVTQKLVSFILSGITKQFLPRDGEEEGHPWTPILFPLKFPCQPMDL